MSVGYQTVKTFDCKSFVTDYEFDYFNVIVHLFLLKKNLVTVYIKKTPTEMGHLKWI